MIFLHVKSKDKIKVFIFTGAPIFFMHSLNVGLFYLLSQQNSGL